MSLWCDKYRPKTLNDLDYNLEEASLIRSLISSPNFPHLSLFGISGSGKKTRVNALLYELFGSSAQKLSLGSKIVETASGKKIEQRYISSNFHIEVNPSVNGFNDRIVIQELIKDLATGGSLSKKHPFKVIVISEADRLTKEAQQGLRRTLEKYVSTCRVILIGERVSRLIPALRSRVFAIRNSAPTHDEITKILKNISNSENIIQLWPDKERWSEDCQQVAINSERNLRRAILVFQALCASSAVGKSKPQLLGFKWFEKIKLIAKKLAESQSTRKVPEIRAMLFDLNVHLIPPELVLKVLMKELLKNCLDECMRFNLIQLAARTDHRIATGSKPVIHLEYFIVNFMALFRSSVEKVAFDLDDPMDVD